MIKFKNSKLIVSANKEILIIQIKQFQPKIICFNSFNDSYLDCH